MCVQESVDEIQRSMNDRQQTDLIFIDFSKAFDTAPHIHKAAKQTEILWYTRTFTSLDLSLADENGTESGS